MPGSALEAVAGYRSRVLGSDRSPGRLPCSLLGLSSSPFSHPGIVSDVPSRLSSGSSLAARGQGDACQRSLRNRPRSGSRLLQSPFPGGEGLWWLETCDRSLSPERVRPADSIQDGNSRFCTVICQRGGFFSFPGSEGRVLSDPIPSIFEEAIEVHVRRYGLPVPSPVFRTVDCSPGLHQGLHSRVSVGTLPRDQTSLLSGRLVGSLLFGARSQAGRPVAPLALSHPRDCDKREEVGSRALADCEVSRHDHRYRGRQGFSVSGVSQEIPNVCGELLYHGRSPSSALAGDLRSPGFARAAGSSRMPSDAHFAVACEGALVPRVRPSLSSGAFATGSDWWMVKEHLLTGVRFGTPAPDLHLYLDASCSGWGAHLLDQHVSGVWSDQEKLLHINLLEMKAFFLGLQAFREDVIGHHVTAMCNNSTVVAYVNKQGGTVSRALCLLTSRLLRWTESFDIHLDARYLPGQANVLADFLSLRGQVVGTEWSLYPQVARSLLRVWGCVSTSLGRPGSVRIPSLSSGRSGDRPCPRVVAGRDDSGRTPLAREGVVHRLTSSTDPTTSRPALVGQSASAAPLQPLPPRRPQAEPSRVATLKRHFRKSGFPGRAARVLSGCLRSNLRLYQSRWQIFCGWCRGRDTVPVVVDFLIHLRHDKGLSVSAVKGYSSALNSVLALNGRDLASSREITMLLRSFLEIRRSCRAASSCMGCGSGSSELDWGSV